MNNPNLIDIENVALSMSLNANVIDFDRMKAYDDETGRERMSIRRNPDGSWMYLKYNDKWRTLLESTSIELEKMYEFYLANRIVT